MNRDQFDNADMWRVVGRACDAFFAREGIGYAPHVERRVRATAIATRARHARNRISGERTYVGHVEPTDIRCAGEASETVGEI